MKIKIITKQGLVQDYSQRIEGTNISGLKLSWSPDFENFNYNNALLNYNNGLKAWKFQILKFQQWSEAGGGGRGVQRNYILISFDS